MNRKEAKKIITDQKSSVYGICKAQGYIGACKDHEPVVVCLKQISTWECCCADGGEPSNCLCRDMIIEMAQKALSEHRKRMGY